MSEEKKAIEVELLKAYLKTFKKMQLGEQFGISKDFIQSLEYCLNLIEKQQKEIEELKDITREYNAFNGAIDDKIIIADDRYFNSGYFKNNYIPKQKILDILNYLNDTDLNNYEIVMAFKKMMKELLEEDGDHIPRID